MVALGLGPSLEGETKKQADTGAWVGSRDLHCSPRMTIVMVPANFTPLISGIAFAPHSVSAQDHHTPYPAQLECGKQTPQTVKHTSVSSTTKALAKEQKISCFGPLFLALCSRTVLIAIREPYVVMGIKTGFSVSKASALPVKLGKISLSFQ